MQDTIEFYKEVFEYLDALKENGEVNMFGAVVYLQMQFAIEKEDAQYILGRWMDTYSDEPAKERAAKCFV